MGCPNSEKEKKKAHQIQGEEKEKLMISVPLVHVKNENRKP
jgi:hypothetical protein